jgi:hypothetical protein
MHYIIFLGIFCLPVIACAEIIATKVWDTFITEKSPTLGPTGASHSAEMDNRASDVIEGFIAAPLETELTP